MHPVDILLILAGVAALVAIAIVPFVLPWPQHLRWLVASMAVPDPTGMSSPPCPLMMREVALRGVHHLGDLVIVEVMEASHVSRGSSYELSRGEATPTTTARLERWSAAHTPLLLVTDDSGEASLHGPAHSVVGLHPVSRDGHADRLEGRADRETIDSVGSRRVRERHSPAMELRHTRAAAFPIRVHGPADEIEAWLKTQ